MTTGSLHAPAAAARVGSGGDGLRVLHLLAPGDAGGLESVVTLLASRQRAAGTDARVAAVLSGDGGERFVAALEARGVPVSAIRVGARAYRAERAAVAALLAALRPDVLHTHGYRVDIVDAPVARRHGVATLSTVHGFTGGGWKLRLSEHLQERALRRHDAVVAVARPIVERLAARGVPRARMALVPNAYEARADLAPRAAARTALALSDEARVVGWIGRLSHEKGADVALRALAHVPDATLAFVGDGPERGALEALAESLGVASRVRWLGLVDDAGRLYRAFDAVVLSSRTEGTPMVLLEAMAAGVPVVASAVGGIPDVVSPAEALLVPSEDPASLAVALRAVLDDRPAAARRAEAASARLAAERGIDGWLTAYLARYSAIVRRA